MTHAAVAEKANGDLDKDKLPWPYCGEIAFTDGGRELILQRDTCINKSCCLHMGVTELICAGCTVERNEGKKDNRDACKCKQVSLCDCHVGVWCEG